MAGATVSDIPASADRAREAPPVEAAGADAQRLGARGQRQVGLMGGDRMRAESSEAGRKAAAAKGDAPPAREGVSSPAARCVIAAAIGPSASRPSVSPAAAMLATSAAIGRSGGRKDAASNDGPLKPAATTARASCVVA